MSISPNAQYRAVETGHIRVAGEFPFYHFRISFSFNFRFLFSPNAMNVILRNIQRHEKKAFREKDRRGDFRRHEGDVKHHMPQEHRDNGSHHEVDDDE